MYCILIDAHLSDEDRLAMLDVFPGGLICFCLMSVHVYVLAHTLRKFMYCILMDAHLSDGAQQAMHDVFSLRGIDPFKVSTRVCVSTHSLIMYVLHSYRCPPLS